MPTPVDSERAHYPIVVLCRVMEVRRSGFYAFLGCGPSLRARHDSVLSAHIDTTFQGSRRTYGSPRAGDYENRNPVAAHGRGSDHLGRRRQLRMSDRMGR